jgi:transposase
MEAVKCPKCGETAKQIKKGLTSASSQKYMCKTCGCVYTPIKKRYSEETKQLAIKIYMSGVSGRGVGKILGISKMTVIRWIKKNGGGVDKSENRFRHI